MKVMGKARALWRSFITENLCIRNTYLYRVRKKGSKNQYNCMSIISHIYTGYMFFIRKSIKVNLILYLMFILDTYDTFEMNMFSFS